MQKRKFDELISHFNRKVAEMNIDQKYKMELLGMISAIGFAHEKELGTDLAEVGTDVPDINVGDMISRQAAIDALRKMQTYKLFSGDDMLLIDQAGAQTELMMLPPAQPKRGRWIGKYSVTSVCSECGFLIHDSKVKAFAYCPNCGAEMEVTT